MSMLKSLLVQQMEFNNKINSPALKPPKPARRSGLVSETPTPKKRGRPRKQQALPVTD